MKQIRTVDEFVREARFAQCNHAGTVVAVELPTLVWAALKREMKPLASYAGEATGENWLAGLRIFVNDQVAEPRFITVDEAMPA